MAGYVREKIQILNDKWSLATPTDKSPKTSLALAQNWRVDRAGHLVSRSGYVFKYAIAGAGYAHSSANNGGDESSYYTAANKNGVTYPGSVYFNGGATPIVTGLSGYRVGFVAMNGFMWIMDRNVQGKHDGTTYSDWGIAGPAGGLTAASGAVDATGPSGTYQFFVTFVNADGSYETAPGSESTAVTVTGHDINFTAIPISSDPLVVARNIYAVGGTLGGAYLVLTIADNTTTTGTWATSDLTVSQIGVALPLGHSLPPSGRGLVGPYYDALYTWVGNRLYYTRPGLPQYWNTDPAVGDWVNVGQDGESIMWCTCHTGVLMIYKEKSIWQLVGDPYTGTLQQVEEGVGLTSAFAICTGTGNVDYFVSPGGLRKCNMNATVEIGPDIRPLFNSKIINAGSKTPPGSILPGPDYIGNVDSLDCYGISLGFAMGKLYVAYDEQAGS